MQPSQATSVLNDRVRLINKINGDVADWLQVCSLCLNPTISGSIWTNDIDACDRNDDGLKKHMPKACENFRVGHKWRMALRWGKLECPEEFAFNYLALQ